MFTPKSNIEVIESVKPAPKQKERVFVKHQRIALTKLNKSLDDLQGRYETSHAYKDPKPSENWKVVKKGETIEQDILELNLKIGIIKAPINENGDFHVKVTPENAKVYLTEMRDWVASLTENNPESEEFKKLAIKAAYPTSKPKAETGHNDWQYNDTTGFYESFLNPNK